MQVTSLLKPASMHGISIILPAYNEQDNLQSAISEILCWAAHSARAYEIIIVDDGSCDSTGQVANALCHDYPQVRAIRHPTNRGYGAALRTGFESTNYPLIFFTDADCQFHIENLTEFLDMLEGGTADLIIGYRVGRYDTVARKVLSWAYNTLVHVMFGYAARDLGCAFKLMRAEWVRQVPLYARDFSINTELVVKARRQGQRVLEIGVAHRPRRAGRSSVGLKHVALGLSGLWGVWSEIHRGSAEPVAQPSRATAKSAR